MVHLLNGLFDTIKVRKAFIVGFVDVSVYETINFFYSADWLTKLLVIVSILLLLLSAPTTPKYLVTTPDC